MEIKLKHIGSTVIEMNCMDGNESVTCDITNLWGLVDEGFIENLEGIAKELKDHNEGINEKLNQVK